MGAGQATRKIETGQRGRPSFVINEEFAVEWLHCAEPEVYCHEARPDRLLKPDTFNTVMFPFSDAGDTARLLKKRYNLKTYELIYFPEEESGSVQNKNGLAINTYVSSDIKPSSTWTVTC
jgi:hypothetical protein